MRRVLLAAGVALIVLGLTGAAGPSTTGRPPAVYLPGHQPGSYGNGLGVLVAP